MKGEEKSVGMDKREDGKLGKFPWWQESESESEPEPEPEPESEEEEQGLIAVIGPWGERVEFRGYPQLLSDAEMALHEVDLYENDRKNIPPDLAPYLWRYFDQRLEQELKDKPLSIDLFPITVPHHDSSSEKEEEEEEEEAKAPEPATHDGKTARDGKRSHSRDGNSSSRDGKRSRRLRKRDRSRNDPTDQHQRRSRRL